MPSRLKSLELHGYKTFASHTQFDFTDQVTAIVGPNGSGKSNIADSIRWVLGEQSYSLLRGKKTEDMIFSGSEQRPRAGMASATIVFDNSDGWLPIDFSEVAITRRAYRDGQNEYLINNQKVRLRDVTELLGQSGLAERTYTVIGQGLVDAALALKAEERRRLFEEAAGIQINRARREETLRRLETTRHNLERVQDILAELQPRLRSLERQAKRAQEYEQIKADLVVLLREWYGYHWFRNQQELTQTRQVAQQREAQLNGLREQQGELDKRLNQMRAKIQGLRDQLGDWHRSLSELHTNREVISRRQAVMDERLRSSQEQLQNMQGEIERLEDEFVLHQERIDHSLQETDRLQAELNEARSQIQAARQALQTRQAERNAAEQELQVARQVLSTQTARQAYLSARLKDRKEQIERQKDELVKLQRAMEASEQEARAAGLRLQHARSLLAEATSARLEAEKSWEAKRNQLAEMDEKREQNREAQSQIQALTARMEAQLEVIEQTEKSLAGYANGARLLIQAMRQGSLKSQGTFSSQIEVSSEYETAIAAALGEYLDAALLSDEESLEQAFKILDDSNARGVVLPIQSFNKGDVPYENPWAGEERVIGLASALIKVGEVLRPVAEMLLGSVLVVSDRATARRLVSEGQPQGSPIDRLVTLQGDVFHLNGPVLIGIEKKPGTLSRPRQRREIQAALEIARQQLMDLQAVRSELDRSMEQLNSEAASMRIAAQRAQESEESRTNEVRQEEGVHEKARRGLAWQNEQIDRVEIETSQVSQEADVMAEDWKRLEVEISQSRETVRVKNTAFAELALDELQTQVSHWNTRAAVAEQAAGDARLRLSERKRALEMAQKTQASLCSRMTEIQVSIEALGTEKMEALETEKSLSVQIEALQERIRPAEAELDGAENENRNFQRRESEARQGLTQAEHHYAQARINLARSQEGLDSLRRRIEEDLGLVEFRYVEKVSGPTPLPLKGMVEQLAAIKEISPDLDENVQRIRAQLRRIGPVNTEAQAEFTQVKERYDFLTSQVADLEKAEANMKEVIAELDMLMEREFRRTFEAVAKEFREIFTRLFGGGMARLTLTAPENMTETGIDIEARLPGRREQGLSLLSGGERSLTAAALVFALLKVSPTPFCVLDEVDAMLDEANVGRFRDLLRELSERTQFVVVTHNRNTVQAADIIYGVTMGRDSSSQVISLKLDEVSQIID